MDPSTLILIAVGVGVAAVFLVVFLVTGKKGGGAKKGRLSGYDAQHSSASSEVALTKERDKELKKALADRVLKPLARMASITGAQDKVVEKLVYAGYRRKGAAEVFMGAKMAMALSLPAAIGGVLVWRANSTGQALQMGHLIMYCAIGLMAGLMLPNFWLSRKVKQRQQAVRFGLPNALDLLVVCIESGLALDAALLRIGREMRESCPELCEELALLNLEVSAGKPRDECLRNLGLRTGVDELKSLSARIIQSSKFGTNLAQSLRIHAESLREKRRQDAEERAAKTSVQLLFPLVFFIFPALFVVILGPAAVSLQDSLM